MRESRVPVCYRVSTKGNKTTMGEYDLEGRDGELAHIVRRECVGLL